MRTSPIGIKKIATREGTILHGYLDSKGLLTVGVGHLVKPGEPYTLNGKITQAESDRLLAQDLHIAESAVNAVKVPLTQNQFDALVSFVVNIGVGGFEKSTVLKRLNAGDYNGAARAMMNWVKPPEITGRRKSEQTQFLTPYKTSTAVQPATKPNGAQPIESATDKGNHPTVEQSSINSETKVEVSAEGGVKVEKTEGAPGPKERVAVVKGSKKRWTSAVWAKIVGIITGSAVFQWTWGQLEKIQDLQVPSNVWIIVSITGAIGTVLWIVHTIVDTWRANRNQERVDQLLVEQNSTPDNLVQLIPADEVDLYRLRGYKIITRGDAGVPLRALTEEEKA